MRIPTVERINFARLEWLIEEHGLPASVHPCKCEHTKDERFHVYIKGQIVDGHWGYDAAWYMLIGVRGVVTG